MADTSFFTAGSPGDAWADKDFALNYPSWLEAGPTEEVLHDIVGGKYGGHPEQQQAGYDYLGGLNFNEIRNEDPYYPMDDSLYKIINPRQNYYGVGGNTPLWGGNLGWSAQYDVDDNDHLLKLMYSMPTDDLFRKLFGGQ